MDAQGSSNTIQRDGGNLAKRFSVHSLDGFSIYSCIAMQSSHAEALQLSDLFNLQVYHGALFIAVVIKVVY